MKRLLIMLTWLGLTARTLPAAWELGFEKTLAELPGGALFIEREAKQAGRAVRIQGVFFQAKDYTFQVIDNPQPGKSNLEQAMQAGGFVAGINGGYFHGDFTPLGLVVAESKEIHRFQRAKLLSGLLVVRNSGPALIRAGEFTTAKDFRAALQAGPFLVDEGKTVTGLESTKLARRTVVASNGKGGFAILLLSPVSLADAGAILGSRSIFHNWPVQRALNMDGGSSSALWVATQPKPFYISEFGSVRNYLGIAEK